MKKINLLSLIIATVDSWTAGARLTKSGNMYPNILEKGKRMDLLRTLIVAGSAFGAQLPRVQRVCFSNFENKVSEWVGKAYWAVN